MRTLLLGLVLASACTVDRSQPQLVGQDIRLTIIHTSDIHSRLFPYNFVPNTFDQGYDLTPDHAPFGGIARIATLVKKFRSETDRSLWLDSGDAWQGAPVFNEFKGEAEIRALSLAGMEGEVLGNHEFDTGSQNLYQKIANWSQFPHLAANYAWDDYADKTSRSLKDVIQPYETYDVNGLQVCVIGMGNTDTLLSSYEGGNSLGFRSLDPSTLAVYVQLIRPSCDLVVVLSHLGLDEDEGVSASQVQDLNENLNNAGVDLILGGHLHIVTNPPKLLDHTRFDDPDSPNCDPGQGCPAQTQTTYCKTNDCRTLLVHSGAFAKYVGKIDLVVHVGENNADPEKRSRIVSFAYNNFPVDNRTPDDPDVAALMWPYSVKLNQDIDLQGVFAYVGNPSDANDNATANGIQRNDTSNGDSQLGNLVARSMMVQQGVDAQFAMTNSLGIRDNFYPGPLTNEQMFNVFPFENTIVVMYLSGEEIQDTLDFVAQKSAARGCRAQAQVAGITFDMVCQGDPVKDCRGQIDPATNLPATACAANIYLGDNCRQGDPNADVKEGTPCAKLDPNGLYRVAVNDYIASGGSGFIVLKRNTSAQNTGVSLRDALTVFLNAQPASCDGMDTKDIVDSTDPQITCKTDGDCSAATPNAACLNQADCPETKCNLGLCQQRTIFQRYGKISCLDQAIEAHDGRIRPVFHAVEP